MPRSARTMNRAPGEARRGLPLAEFLPEGLDNVALGEHLRQVFATGEPLLDVEVAWQAQRRTLASFHPVCVEGRVERVALTVVDGLGRHAEG